jgi:hypothetical protein
VLKLQKKGESYGQEEQELCKAEDLIIPIQQVCP